jgi:hypothetical protein
MKDFLQALSNFSLNQLLTSLAILLPVIAGIWFALRWAYETRTKNLEANLKEYQSDFERRIARELSKTTDEHEKLTKELSAAHCRELELLHTELETTRSNLDTTQSDLKTTQASAESFKEEIQRIEQLHGALVLHIQLAEAYESLMADFSGATFARGNILPHWRSTTSNLDEALSDALRLDLLKFGSSYYWATNDGKAGFKALAHVGRLLSLSTVLTSQLQ